MYTTTILALILLFLIPRLIVITALICIIDLSHVMQTHCIRCGSKSQVNKAGSREDEQIYYQGQNTHTENIAQAIVKKNTYLTNQLPYQLSYDGFSLLNTITNGMESSVLLIF
jgi:hypothetical protein